MIPFEGFKAINLFGVLFVRKGVNMTAADYNHELIHTEQMKELLYIPFYVLYAVEWFIKLFRYGKNAYLQISFEREAFEHMYDLAYLDVRRKFAFVQFIFKNKKS
jgi:hypothetical protein